MVKLAHIFNKIAPRRILVAGDFMLDRYTFGTSRRISPEAPVPVLLVNGEDERPGGAGNVVLNLISLGMNVSVLGRVGDDSAGKRLQAWDSFQQLFTQKNFKTPEKVRIIASNQQIVRIDYEKAANIDPLLEKQVIDSIDSLVQKQDIVAISDYGKGFLTDNILQALIAAAKKYKIPVIADPKGVEFTKYAHATILKPNLSEAYAAAGFSSSGGDLREVAKIIFSKVTVDVLMITRSEAGISLYYPDGRVEDHPVAAKAIRDVTGAGDTVLAMLACGLANGISLSETTDLANIAASVAVERVGCAQVTLSEIAERLIEVHASNKIFAHEHLSALEYATKEKDITHLRLQKNCTVNAELLRALRTVATEKEKGKGKEGKEEKATKKRELIVSIFDPTPDEELVSVLASLQDVNYIHMGTECALQVAASQTYDFSHGILKKTS